MTDPRLRARGQLIADALKKIDVDATVNRAELWTSSASCNVEGHKVVGPKPLFGFSAYTGKPFLLQLTEFEIFEGVCRFVAPIGYGHAEFAEAWEITREWAEAEMEKERLKCN